MNSEMERTNRIKRLIRIGAAVEHMENKKLEREELQKYLEKIRLYEQMDFLNNDLHRLASIGSIAEDVLGRKMDESELWIFRLFLEQQESRGKYYSNVFRKNGSLPEMFGSRRDT